MVLKKCNICGKELDFWDMQEDFSFERSIGYGSIHDGSKVSIKLCCDCFDKILDSILLICEINPIEEV